MPLGRGLSSLIPSFKTAPVFQGAVKIAASGEGGARLWHAPLSSIKPNPYQPRKNFSHQDLEDLVNSIKEHGIIQPLIVSEAADGSYEIIAGERRFRAAQIAGLPTVPVIARPVKDLDKLELSLIENIQRRDLNPIEEAFAYERLVDEFGLTHEEIAKKIGKSRSYVSNTLRLLTLPSEIQKGLIDGAVSSTLGRTILGLPSAREQLKMFRQLQKEKSTVGAMEEKAAAARLESSGETRRDPIVLDQEKRLREVLGTKVKITKRGEKGAIKINYYSLEELNRLVKAITRR